MLRDGASRLLSMRSCLRDLNRQAAHFRIPSAFDALALLTISHRHVQQRSPGAILRTKMLGLSTGPGNASAKSGNVQEECPWRP